ncbi:Trypsin Inhibitor-like, cysteine rich domain protein [Nannochloropsis gaditana]|uniref:Trypsin Inhibitor-like, cysteine rich domain protein n=1 Tax=Nannochloropsis gaditana TaxID=72520 RepID=W7TGG3_9STRA|nr:Trypsin Inhibitor-like, cysteine rich domain protein [Nannochloropsis gaditana]
MLRYASKARSLPASLLLVFLFGLLTTFFVSCATAIETSTTAYTEELDARTSSSHSNLRPRTDHPFDRLADLEGTKGSLNGKIRPKSSEREIFVPPAAEEETLNPLPRCPKNAHYSFCAIEPKCAATCAEHRDSQEKEATGVVKMCNRMCYQRCDCLPDFYLLDGFCISEEACLSIGDAKTASKKRQVREGGKKRGNGRKSRGGREKHRSTSSRLPA